MTLGNLSLALKVDCGKVEIQGGDGVVKSVFGLVPFLGKQLLEILESLEWASILYANEITFGSYWLQSGGWLQERQSKTER